MNDCVFPEVMAVGLAVMTKLENLTIQFNSGCPLPAQNIRARVILPSLTQFQFQGSDRYLEDLVAQLDTPRLFDLTVVIQNLCARQSRDSLLQLFQFIDHAEDLKLAQFKCAHLEIFHSYSHSICFYNAQAGQHSTHFTLGEVGYHWSLDYGDQDSFSQLHSMRALLSQASATISHVQHLSITTVHETIWEIFRDRDESIRFFHLFDTVKTLHTVGRQFTNYLVPMLNGLSNKLVAEVLPALHLLKCEGKPQKIVKKLLASFIKSGGSLAIQH